ncbi:MAG: YcxB family protein [Thermaceae bacterium]
MEYEAQLRALGKPTLAELKGTGGLLAVTEEELIFLDPGGMHRLELASIRRVQRGEGGKILVIGGERVLEIPLGAFSVNELKAFLEGLKTHVARARELLAEKARKPSPPVSPSPPLSAASKTQEQTERKVPAQTSPPPEEEPLQKPQLARRKNPLALSSRLLALLSLAYGLGFALLNPTDPWIQLGVLLASLNFFVLLWGPGSSSSS